MEKAALGLLKCSLDRYIEMRKEEGRPTALRDPESSSRPGRHHLQGVSRLAQGEEVLEQVCGVVPASGFMCLLCLMREGRRRVGRT